MYVLFSDGLVVVFTEYGDTEEVRFILHPVNGDRMTCHLLELILIGRGKLCKREGFKTIIQLQLSHANSFSCK